MAFLAEIGVDSPAEELKFLMNLVDKISQERYERVIDHVEDDIEENESTSAKIEPKYAIMSENAPMPQVHK